MNDVIEFALSWYANANRQQVVDFVTEFGDQKASAVMVDLNAERAFRNFNDDTVSAILCVLGQPKEILTID